MKDKIVLITAGGHISSFHAAMKSMYLTLERVVGNKFEIYGARGGLTGLIEDDFIPVFYEDIDENRAGSLIGTDRKKVSNYDINRIVENVSKNNIYAIVMMGGDNHMAEAARLYEETHVNIVAFPKTMDGDLSSFITLGWDTAVTIGAINTRLHYCSAMTSGGVFYVGLFGRNTDWVICGVDVYGVADRSIPCEQTYEWGFVWEKILNSLKENEQKYDVRFAVVPYSEGARINGLNTPLPEHQSIDKHGEIKLSSEWVGMELVRLTKRMGEDARFQAHTYSMRDSPPTRTDKILSAMAGEECIEMILEEDFGKAVLFQPDGNGFYITERAEMKEISKKRKVKDTEFFDYLKLKSTDAFISQYENLFSKSLGEITTKDDLVYRNMLRGKGG